MKLNFQLLVLGLCLFASSAVSQWLGVQVATYSNDDGSGPFSMVHGVIAGRSRSQSFRMDRSCSRQMPLLSSVAVNVTSKGLTCFGCLNLQGGLSSTSIGCFDPLTGIPIAVISTVPAAGLFAMPAPDGYNYLFLPTIDGRSGSILFDPVSRNILKIISTIGFQGLPYSMALDARSNNTVYNWSPKTGYVARDFLIETQMLSGSNPNLFSTFACNGYGQYPYEYVQLLWDDTRNSLLAVMRYQDAGTTNRFYLQVARISGSNECLVILGSGRLFISKPRFFAALNSKQQQLGIALESETATTAGGYSNFIQVDLASGSVSSGWAGFNMETLAGLVWSPPS